MRPTENQLWRMARPLLLPFSWLYGLGVFLRNLGYDSGWAKIHRIPVPVISIGNLSAGGTGKTTLTLSLARLLQNDPYQLSPAVLSRGYRRSSWGYQLVSAGEGSLCGWEQSGDEPQLYARKLTDVPVAVDADRVRGGNFLVKHFAPSVILLDDGFQHRRLHRDLDIVLLNSGGNIQSDHLLPAGLLREPQSSLRRAHLIVLTYFLLGETESERIWRTCAEHFGEHRLLACRNKMLTCTDLRTGEKFPLEDIRGMRLIPFCGIARPESFRKILAEQGAEIPFLIRFQDHHKYGPRDVERLATAYAEERSDYLITTEKDAVKLGGLFEALPILVLEVEIEWLKGLDNLHRELAKLFGSSGEKG